jgi:hypothetical protein
LQALTLNMICHGLLSAAWHTFRRPMPLEACATEELIVHDDMADD